MIKTVRTDGRFNYFYNKSTGEIIDRYDPSNNRIELLLTFENSELRVSNDNIIQDFTGQVMVQYNNDRYIIDDGYQNHLIKAGYIIYKNYDKEKCSISEGPSVRSDIIENIRKTLENMYSPMLGYFISGTETEFKILDNSYKYNIRITSVDQLVNKNHQRRDNNLTYYPFDKNMDKFGTLYLTIFAQKIDDKNSDKFRVPDDFLMNFIKELGVDYHYTSLPIKGRVLYSESV